MSTVGIITATYGGNEWLEIGKAAEASAMAQTVPVEFTWIHTQDFTALGTLRNRGAAELDTDYYIFLDADDTLAPNYVEEMLKVDADIIQPATLGVVDGVEDPMPVLIPRKRLIDQNFIVIGAMVDAPLFQAVGGFDDYPIYEDWELWLKMYCAGAVIGKAPAAIYRVGIRSGYISRNNEVALQSTYYRAIRDKHQEYFAERGWED